MYGLALQGGGTKGAYEVGVWKGLRELDIPISGVAGTSIGALIGAMIVQDRYDELCDIWEHLSPNTIFSGDESFYRTLFDFDLSKRDEIYKNILEVFQNRGLDISPLKAMIHSFSDEKRIRESVIDFGLVTVSVSDLKPILIFKEDIPNGEMANYLMASAYVPGFKMEALAGKYYVDGGIYDNLPIRMLEDRGYDNIIAVGLSQDIMRKKVKKSKANIIEIIPSDDVGMMFNFDQENANRNVTMGYLDTLKLFGKYSGTQYYIHTLPTEDEVMRKLNGLDTEKILQVAEKIACKKGNPRRLLYEQIIPEIVYLLDCRPSDDYLTVHLKLIETIAEIYKIPKYKPYAFDELEREVAAKLDDRRLNRIDYNHIPEKLRNRYLLKYTAKEDVLLDIVKLMYS